MSRAFDPAWLGVMRQRLLEHKAQLERQLSDLRSVVRAESQYQDEEGPVANHPADEASDLLAAEVDTTISRALEDELNAVKTALKRFDSDSYGICVDCGQPIERERLEAIPWALRCLRDQQKLDAARSRRRP